MSESYLTKLLKAMDIAKQARVGMTLTYFDVIELSGEINSLREYIADLEAKIAETKCDEIDALTARNAELEALVEELVDSGDNLFDSLNPIAWKHEWLDKWWKLSNRIRKERE